VDVRGAGVGIVAAQDCRPGAHLGHRTRAGNQPAEADRVGLGKGKDAIVGYIPGERSGGSVVANLKRPAADRGSPLIVVEITGQGQGSRSGLRERSRAGNWCAPAQIGIRLQRAATRVEHSLLVQSEGSGILQRTAVEGEPTSASQVAKGRYG